MATTVHEVEAHIEDARRALGANLDELEQKVDSALDWRKYVRRQPWPSLALAFGAGFLLSGLFGGRRREPLRLVAGARGAQAGRYAGPRPGNPVWDAAKAALMGLATAAVTTALEQVAVRAREHFDQPDTAEATVVMPGSGSRPEA